MRYYEANKNNVASKFAIVSLAWLLQPIASAQTDAELLDAARACQRITGLSSRLQCYDRAFPPAVESAAREEAPAVRVEPAPVASPPERAAAPASNAAPARNAEPAPPRAASSASAFGTTARIVEVQTPKVGVTRFRAEDGRVFVRSDLTSIPRWPEAPFDVEIQTARFGTSTFLHFPGTSLRVRVAVEMPAGSN